MASCQGNIMRTFVNRSLHTGLLTAALSGTEGALCRRPHGMVLPVQLEFFLGRECQAAPAATKPVQELSEVQPPSTSTAFTQVPQPGLEPGALLAGKSANHCVQPKNVFNMGDEWEEEEQLVVVELSGIIDNELLTKNRGTCKILDIDSEKPMMQIGHYVFAGKYEDALGTCVLFEEVPQKENSSKAPDLKYMCQTVKKLTMERIFLMEKKEGETNTGSDADGEQKDTNCQSIQEQDKNLQKLTQDNMDTA
ncbi:general transcription factor 3C polypeptide 6 isoform X3 [Oryzias latipes]